MGEAMTRKNTPAMRFYTRRGFCLVELSDGSGNEEREPDALYEWRRWQFTSTI